MNSHVVKYLNANPHFFTWYWALWLIAFLAPELYFVIFNSAGTLSDNVWWLEDVNMQHPFDFPMWNAVHWSVAVVVWGLFGWLSIHLPFGLLR